MEELSKVVNKIKIGEDQDLPEEVPAEVSHRK
jgi:hypothetical protein